MKASPITTPSTYCLIPPELAGELHDLLRIHFRGDPSIVVVIDRRWPKHEVEQDDPRARASLPNGDRVVSAIRTQATDARSAFVELEEPPPLPSRARRHAARVRFLRHAAMSEQAGEDETTARLVEQAKTGDVDAFATLYVRYFDRIYAYLRMNLRDRHEAEDLAQQVFVNALDRLDQQKHAFRPWLFRIARNVLLDHLKKNRPMLIEDPQQLPNGVTVPAQGGDALRSQLSLMSESEVAMLIERLPMAQRQVVILRYLIGLTFDEVADVLNRTTKSVQQLDYRARQYLRPRLTALRRTPDVKRRRAGLLLRTRVAPVLRERRFALLRR